MTRLPSVAAAAWLAVAIALPSSASAESGRFNLHLDLGASIPALGDIGDASLGPHVSAAFDWQIVTPFAIQLRYGFSYFPADTNVEGASSFVTDHAFGLGGRFRFLDNREGYMNQDGGDPWGNLWVDAHIGVHHFFDDTRFGGDIGVGYEYSVFSPIQIGVFARFSYVLAGSVGEDDAYVSAGVSFSLELGGRTAALDTDGDGLSDERETNEHRTDPNDPDSDDDGLSDGVEVEGNTDPNNPDSDGDELPDGREDANHDGVRQPSETDPRVADTDRGGAPDGWEVQNSRNPTNRADDDNDQDRVVDHRDACLDTARGARVDARGCAVLERSLVLDGVEFDSDSATIRPASFPVLDRAIAILRDNPDVRVQIQGHTDNTGRASRNRELSQQRAESVRQYLIEHGIPEARLEARGFGPSRPRAPNDTEEGRARNRRIEFHRLD